MICMKKKETKKKEENMKIKNFYVKKFFLFLIYHKIILMMNYVINSKLKKFSKECMI